MKKLGTNILLILFLSAVMSVSAGENRRFERQRLSMAVKIENSLILKELCISKKDCQQKKLFFVSPGPRGLGVKTYAINSPSVLSTIVEIAAAEFYEGGVDRIEIENFSYSKEEDLRSFLKQGPAFSTVILER